ncbi:hypothetical protein P154DRAFT_521412 [Amniculicola lignicola CBS 123094]|uniref:Stress-response A/B barrel domain-containing protein n=1 Tax=Amniculicola lignicola CBS 123094 TaxID=1392246 RepID=A0A6A5WKH6_9PLEO|nr:hypothetical protein P154DRAFT_521412 [Amniculicola lignicola CBS 123094]
MPQILRLTCFKIPEAAHIQEALRKYETLTQDAVKDGKPYIQSAGASQTYDDPRNGGHTLVARTTFASKEDMDFYDNECEAHQSLKAVLKGKVAGPPLILYMDA